MQQATVAQMRASHRVLSEFYYEPVKIEKGYASRFLRIDLSSNSISILPVTEEIKKLWVGGKGFDLWFMFQEINPNTKWDSPENPIAMCSGPLGGTTSFPGSGKTLVTSISPLTNSIMDCNVGGYFGPYLKFSGFDGLIIVGKASTDIIILIDATKHRITIEEAPLESIDSHLIAEELTEMYADDEEDKRNIAVVSSGRAANYVRMGMLNFSFWDWRRKSVRFKQAGRGGIGRVFRDKKLKALVLKAQRMLPPWSVTESKVQSLIPVPSDISDTGCSCQYMNKEEIKKIIAKWNCDPEYVIEMMQDIQEKDRHISKLAIQTISLETGVPKGQLYHIATFYKAFSLVPRGKNIIQVCVGTACHVKGSLKVLEAFERELNITRGQTTPDKNFSLEAVACLGCCSIAPVVKINDDIFGNVQAKDVAKILKTYQQEASDTLSADQGDAKAEDSAGDALPAKELSTKNISQESVVSTPKTKQHVSKTTKTQKEIRPKRKTSVQKTKKAAKKTNTAKVSKTKKAKKNNLKLSKSVKVNKTKKSSMKAKKSKKAISKKSVKKKTLKKATTKKSTQKFSKSSKKKTILKIQIKNKSSNKKIKNKQHKAKKSKR